MPTYVSDMVPEGLMDKSKWRELADWLRRLDADPRGKKYFLMDWVDETGATLTEELVERAGAR